ncbi:MAG: 50S ribosomal protein L21 [Candidatus Omnitrophica bacterium]|nr:50S ribosomal protein L21 [Candidatus Omnitrophota bacterium]
MYAIIELQGTQVRVEKNSKIVVNRIKEQKKKTIKIDNVLFGKKGSTYFVGEPYVKGAYAECEILGDKRGKKLIAFKYRDRKSSQSKIGHRQDLTELVVKDIHFAETAKPIVEKTETKAKEAEKKTPAKKIDKE